MAHKGSGIFTLHTSSGVHALRLRLAESFLTRVRGLMLSSPLPHDEGMLITHCTSVHSAFMRYPIDLLYLDRNGVVVRCVPNLKPWRISHGALGNTTPRRHLGRTAHVLELAVGTIATLAIVPGARLEHPCWDRQTPARMPSSCRQRGSAMIEFTIVGPLIAMLGLGILQYGMLFFAKNQINYATFMAGREGSVGHADPGSVKQAYTRALAPLYGGGESMTEVAEAVGKASADLADNLNIELLNPTKESFGDWNDPLLQTRLKTGGRRVIPNASLATKPQEVKTTSGQSLQDANLLKLKITHGYLPKVPFVSKLYITYLKWLDPHTDAFRSKLIEAGRIPVVTHVTVQMQSDAIESNATVSSPGQGNGGSPANPGVPPVSQEPLPDCTNIGCEVATPAPEPACNPFTDPNHCDPTVCIPSSQVCCKPKEGPL